MAIIKWPAVCQWHFKGIFAIYGIFHFGPEFTRNIPASALERLKSIHGTFVEFVYIFTNMPLKMADWTPMNEISTLGLDTGLAIIGNIYNVTWPRFSKQLRYMATLLSIILGAFLENIAMTILDTFPLISIIKQIISQRTPNIYVWQIWLECFVHTMLY